MAATSSRHSTCLDDDEVVITDPESDFAERVCARLDAEDALAHMSERTIRIVKLHNAGFARELIAETVGVTPECVRDTVVWFQGKIKIILG